jgi:hypothetical protein
MFTNAFFVFSQNSRNGKNNSLLLLMSFKNYGNMILQTPLGYDFAKPKLYKGIYGSYLLQNPTWL